MRTILQMLNQAVESLGDAPYVAAKTDAGWSVHGFREIEQSARSLRGHECKPSGHGHPPGVPDGVQETDLEGACGRRHVDDPQSTGAVRDKGVVTGHGDSIGVIRSVDERHFNGARGRRNVDHPETILEIRNVRIAV